MNTSSFTTTFPSEKIIKPIEVTERIEFLDVLRGIAICGILFGNMPYFIGYSFMSEEQAASLPLGMANHITIFFTHIFIEGKFYSIFSLLFGIGFAVQLMRANAKGKDFISFYIRRLFFLLVIGLIHLVFLWNGDILTAYAITGFVLILFRNMKSDTLLKIALFLLVLPVLQYAVVLFSGSNIHPGTPLEIGAGYVRNLLGITGGSRVEAIQGDYSNWLIKNVQGLFYRFSNLLFTGRFFKVLAMFLVGYYIGKVQMARNLSNYIPLLKKIVIIGLAIGLPFNLALAWLMESGDNYPPSLLGFYQSIVYLIGVVPLSLAFAALIALAWQKIGWQKRLSVFSPLGKMALTNYLLQSIICIFTFNGFGFGLVGRIGPFISLAIILSIIFFQILFSKWWLSRYQFGPAEWLWRSLTYGKIQNLKLKKV